VLRFASPVTDQELQDFCGVLDSAALADRAAGAEPNEDIMTAGDAAAAEVGTRRGRR
jgi:hypothetical protein